MAKLLVLALALLAISYSSAGQDPQEFLFAHNQARAAVGVAPITWSASLANSAEQIVQNQRDWYNCALANMDSSIYGSNQFWHSPPVINSQAVESWVKEQNYYDYDSNTCIGGHKCGLYTQVVWSRSMELGCAQFACSQQQSSLTICLYNPTGNVLGQRPY